MDVISVEPLVTDRPFDILRWQEKQMPGLTYIYHLLCPLALTVRYIGISQEPYKRFSHHLRAPTGTHKSSWIKNLRGRGFRPCIFICEGFENREDAKSAERRLILTGRRWLPLTNLTDGGDYPSNKPMSAECREMHRQRMLTDNPNLGGLSEEHKRKIAETVRMITNKPEIRRRRSEQAKRAKRLNGRFAK